MKSELHATDAVHAIPPVVPVLRHCGPTAFCGTLYHADPDGEGPPIVIVGSLASDASIVRLAWQYGMDSRALIEFARNAGGDRLMSLDNTNTIVLQYQS